MEPYIGKFFSMDWVKRNVLHQTEEEIQLMQQEMDAEEELHIDFASREGELQGVMQTAASNYQANNDQQYIDQMAAQEAQMKQAAKQPAKGK